MVAATLYIQIKRDSKRSADQIYAIASEARAMGMRELDELMADPKRMIQEGFVKDGEAKDLEKIQALRHSFGEYCNSEKAMLTAPELFQRMQACKDPVVLAQFMQTAVALKIADTKDAHEWVSKYAVELGGAGVRSYPAKSRRVRATASIPID